MNFATALKHLEPSSSAQEAVKMVDLDEWVFPQQLVDRSASSASGTADILDHSFVDFHRAFKEHMMDNYGMLCDSEAFDLHEVIVCCVAGLADS